MEKLGKHKHLLTNILKVGIFSLVMLAPLLAVGSKCLYVACNKNAYKSYYGETINQENEKLLTTQDQFKINEEYMFNSNTFSYNGSNKGAYARGITLTNFKIVSIANITLNVNNPTYIGLYIGSNQLSVRISNNTDDQTIYFNGNQMVFKFTYISDNLSVDFKDANIFYKVEYNNKSYLDNAFYYAFDQIAEEPLFNWTKDTGTYTAINAMMTGLGLSNNHPLTICLCYWFIIMMIYIVVDIVVVCFTKLTHFYSDGE